MQSNHAWVLLVAGLGILHAVSPAPAVRAAHDDPGLRAFLHDVEASERQRGAAGGHAGDGADDAARHLRLPQGGRPVDAAAAAHRSASSRRRRGGSCRNRDEQDRSTSQPAMAQAGWMWQWLKRRNMLPRGETAPTSTAPQRRRQAGADQPLFDYLEDRYAQTVVLTFEQIEDLLGTGLPEPARRARWLVARAPGRDNRRDNRRHDKRDDERHARLDARRADGPAQPPGADRHLRTRLLTRSL